MDVVYFSIIPTFEPSRYCKCWIVCFYNKEDKVMTYATAFCMVSAGVLMLAFVPSAIGIRQTQKAQAFNLMADGHRMLGLAKSYDAKAAAIALKTVTSEVL